MPVIELQRTSSDKVKAVRQPKALLALPPVTNSNSFSMEFQHAQTASVGTTAPPLSPVDAETPRHRAGMLHYLQQQLREKDDTIER